MTYFHKPNVINFVELPFPPFIGMHIVTEIKEKVEIKDVTFNTKSGEIMIVVK
ncbi:MAG: hypothetical protein AAB757_00700 [Patescibacteria group bacterium]